MELEYKRRERLVGFFLFVVALLLLATVMAVGRGKDWFRSYVDYYAEFQQAYNLQKNAAVKLAKTQIGKVKKIDLSGNRVRVDLAILEEYAPRIREGSIALVESPTLIGDQYVAIRPGPTNEPEIPRGGLIASEERKSVDDIINEFRLEETAKNVVQAVNEVTDIVHRLHDPEGPLFATLNRLAESLTHVEAILAGIDKGEGTVGEILRSDRLAQEIYKSLTLTEQILGNVEKTTEKVPPTVDEINQSLAQVNEVMGSVNKLLATLQTIMENIETASHDVPKVTRSSERGINEMRETMRDVDKVVRSIQQNPLIRGNLPPEPEGEETDAELRP